MRIRATKRLARWAVAAGVGIGLAAGVTADKAEAKTEDGKFLVYYSMSYVGNAWQTEAKNTVIAMAKAPQYRDRVELRVQASGPDAQKQIQQMNAMIAAGADAIVAFPISPTALNKVIR
ncbi:MAG: substrate-binding domain-containing protein, partial [Rhodospirillaceae bacterium]|nr:substrate-binding domain-containing protein [Rhodospirillaceae bacterium]